MKIDFNELVSGANRVSGRANDRMRETRQEHERANALMHKLFLSMPNNKFIGMEAFVSGAVSTVSSVITRIGESFKSSV